MAAIQQKLLEIPAQASMPEGDEPGAAPKKTRVRPAKLKPINRAQMVFRSVDVERLIGEDHRARAIWELTGRINLTAFLKEIKSEVGEVGRASWNPRLLVSIWVYADSEGMTSAREIEREMEHEPGLMWLSGLEIVNHHTLSDFRSNRREALEQVFQELLAVLEAEGLVDLQQVMVDGTKIRAQASMGSFRRGAKISEHLKNAQELMDQIQTAEKQGRSGREAARQRAREERLGRLEAARKQYEELQASKKEKDAAAVRVSESEPEARRMKQSDGGYAPSYNVQLSTDGKAKMVVGVHLTQEQNDLHQLEAAVEQVEQTLGRKPEQVVADGGYASRENILKMAEEGVEFISTLANEEKKAQAALKGQGVSEAFYPGAFRWDEEKKCFYCPAGKRLEFQRNETRQAEHCFAIYRAQLEDCQGCEYRPQCCPKGSEQGRMVKRVVRDHAAMEAFREKMKEQAVQEIYKRRAPVSETVNAWLKEKMGVRRFRLRGMAKAGAEVLWACLSYNIVQWIRLRSSVTTAALA